ncbi:MAG: glycosyltransferase [bacterium]
MKKLQKYEKLVGEKIINEINEKAKKLKGRSVVAVNSARHGGGVSELLDSVIVLFNEIGIKFGWRVIHDSPDFFSITKKIHNALQGEDVKFSEKEKEFYKNENRRFAEFAHIDHDLVIVHDPQPLPLINFYKRKQPWILRLHVDLTRPDRKIWNFLKPFINKYDHLVVSDNNYKKKLNLPQTVIYPAIDPLSPKNKNLSAKVINKKLSDMGINFKKPIIAQISRYDKWKDPEGVIKIFDLVKKKSDCHLVLLGNSAVDDPEGSAMYNNLREKYGRRKDISLLVNVKNNDLAVNVLQRRADVVIQKSIKEGFGLTVAEALYKGTPVVGSGVGGIVHQIIPGYNGYLHEPSDYKGFSKSIIKILKNNKLRQELGDNGRAHIIENFLITRLILDWLNLFEKVLKK